MNWQKILSINHYIYTLARDSMRLNWRHSAFHSHIVHSQADLTTENVHLLEFLPTKFSPTNFHHHIFHYRIYFTTEFFTTEQISQTNFSFTTNIFSSNIPYFFTFSFLILLFSMVGYIIQSYICRI